MFYWALNFKGIKINKPQNKNPVLTKGLVKRDFKNYFAFTFFFFPGLPLIFPAFDFFIFISFIPAFPEWREQAQLIQKKTNFF